MKWRTLWSGMWSVLWLGITGNVVYSQIPAGIILYYEDFDTITLSNDCRVDAVLPGWEIGDGGTCQATSSCGNSMRDTTWVVTANPYSPIGGLVQNQGILIDWSSGCIQMDTLYTPYFNISGDSFVYFQFVFDFNFWFTNWGKVQFLDSAGGWIDVDSISGQDISAKRVYRVDSFITPHDSFRVRFIYYDNADFYWQIDSVILWMPFPYNLRADQAELNASCPTMADSLRVVVANAGLLDAIITSADSLVLVGWIADVLGNILWSDTLKIYPDTIPAGSGKEYRFFLPSGINFPDTFFYGFFLRWTSDTVYTDDTLVLRFQAVPSPHYETFGTGFWWDVSTLGTGWEERRGPCCNPLNASPGDYSWVRDDWRNVAGDNAAKINIWITGKQDYLLSPLVRIPSDSPEILIRFRLGIWEFTTQTPGQLGSDDSVVVMYSLDCGQSWQTLLVLDNSNTPIGDSIEVCANVPNVSGYVRFAVWGSEGSVDDLNDNDIMIDDVVLKAYRRDAELAGVQTGLTSDTVCPGEVINLNAVVENRSDCDLDSIFWRIQVQPGILVDSGYMFVGLPYQGSIPVSLGSFVMPAGVDSVVVQVEVYAHPWDAGGANSVQTITLYRMPPPSYTLIVPDTAIEGVTISVGIFPMGTPVNTVQWNFGPNAQPQFATGMGPISVRYDTTGWQVFEVLLIFCNGADTLRIVDSIYVDVRVPTGIAEGQNRPLVRLLGNVSSIPIIELVHGKGITMDRIEIYSADGKQVYTSREHLQVTRYPIPVNELPVGRYVVRVYLSDGTVVFLRLIAFP